jgi:predicted permease
LPPGLGVSSWSGIVLVVLALCRVDVTDAASGFFELIGGVLAFAVSSAVVVTVGMVIWKVVQWAWSSSRRKCGW